MVFSLAACGKSGSEETPELQELKIAALKGPTAMGLVKLMKDSETEASDNKYQFTLAGSADEITPLLIKGELDAACIPANLASVLYTKTSGAIQVLAVNTLGVLYIVDTDGSIESMADLKGKTVVSSGKGSTPEYALRFLLSENGLDPDKDVEIVWKSEHAECVSALAAKTASVAMLPQPFVTVAAGKVEGLNVSLDLNEEWDKLGLASSLITGVVVVRKEYAAANRSTVETFLSDYSESVSWVNANTGEAAAIIGEYGIVAENVAKQALPFCNIVCVGGDEMKAKLSGYLEVLFGAAPESVGGKLPEADFYFK